MRRLIISHAARREFQEAVHWFDENTDSPTVGDDFTSVVNRAFAKVLEHPERHGPCAYGGRRMLLEPFKYAMHFVESGEIIKVIAIWSQRRNPELLRTRIARSL
jgi:plasmid stabilization system protein ParE